MGTISIWILSNVKISRDWKTWMEEAASKESASTSIHRALMVIEFYVKVLRIYVKVLMICVKVLRILKGILKGL